MGGYQLDAGLSGGGNAGFGATGWRGEEVLSLYSEGDRDCALGFPLGRRGGVSVRDFTETKSGACELLGKKGSCDWIQRGGRVGRRKVWGKRPKNTMENFCNLMSIRQF